MATTERKVRSHGPRARLSCGLASLVVGTASIGETVRIAEGEAGGQMGYCTRKGALSLASGTMVPLPSTRFTPTVAFAGTV
jgi:hypothetical protein